MICHFQLDKYGRQRFRRAGPIINLTTTSEHAVRRAGLCWEHDMSINYHHSLRGVQIMLGGSGQLTKNGLTFLFGACRRIPALL